MTRDQVKDPNGSGKRVEALTIGVWPATTILLASVVICASAVGMYFSLKSEITEMKSLILINTGDRWTRSMTKDLCRRLEKDNHGFKCPDILPQYEPPFRISRYPGGRTSP